MIYLEMKILNHNAIIIQLDELIAPIAVNSVVELVKKGSYNNRRIERLEPDFVLQPLFFDEGDFAMMIEGEFKTNILNHNLKFERGTVAMAGDADNASAGQFFITLKPKDRLNGNFTIIGKVVDGFEEIERIEKVEVVLLVDQESSFTYHIPKIDEVVEYIKIIEE